MLLVPRPQEDRKILIVFNMIRAEWLYQGLEQNTYIIVHSIILKGIALESFIVLVLPGYYFCFLCRNPTSFTGFFCARNSEQCE